MTTKHSEPVFTIVELEKGRIWAARFDVMKRINAQFVIDRACREGLLKEGGVVIETTSGSMGLGIAEVCKMKGFRCILVTDPGAYDDKVKREFDRLDATVVVVARGDDPGATQERRLNMVRELLKVHVGAFWTRQYDDPWHVEAYDSVAAAIDKTIPEQPLVIVASVGSGSSACGITHGLRQRARNVQLIGVDLSGSVLFGLPSGRRLIRGMGNGIIPRNLRHEMFDEVHWLSDALIADCANSERSRRLDIGPTSAAAAFVADWASTEFKDRQIVCVFPDSANRYHDTVMNPAWRNDQQLESCSMPKKPDLVEDIPNGAPKADWTRISWGGRSLSAAKMDAKSKSPVDASDHDADTSKLYGKYVLQIQDRAQITIVRGEGSYVWDDKEKKYLDFAPGLGVCGLGHCPPRVVQAIRDQAGVLIHAQNRYFNRPQALLAEALSRKIERWFESVGFFCNSGTEAVETALKIARKSRPDRPNFVAMKLSFHGRTFGSLSASGQRRLQVGFEPLLSKFDHVPLNDIAALSAAVDARTAGVLIEPVQGEGGVHIATKNFLDHARRVCDNTGALLIYDEIQSGMYRTGNTFGFETLDGPAPDILCLAKNLAAGLPIGAVMVRKALVDGWPTGWHGSTYGGSALTCAAALAALEVMEDQGFRVKLVENCRIMAVRLSEIASAHRNVVKESRSLGMIGGIELHDSAAPVVKECVKSGLLVNSTQEKVIRLLPSLDITKADLEKGLDILDSAIKRYGDGLAI